MIHRSVAASIKKDLEKKIVLLSGPRQTGKTTLSKNLFKDYQYLNFDSVDHRKIILLREWDRRKQLIILDEIHKMDEWKRWLKGIYDTEGVRPRILVTGSARLETLTNVGDSLAGRFFSYRLHPFDVAELSQVDFQESAETVLHRITEFSGFPEPFLEGDSVFFNRWKNSHIDTILREDLISLVEVKNISKLKLLITLLQHRIASPISYRSLAEDLDVSYKSVQSWIELLEKLYVIFRVHPYHQNVARAIKKEPKYYFYNCALVADAGARLENIVALALQKKAHYLTDTQGKEASLHYLRTRDGDEVDFLLKIDGDSTLIEVKLSDSKPSGTLLKMAKYFKDPQLVQVVFNLAQAKSTSKGVFLYPAAEWLKFAES